MPDEGGQEERATVGLTADDLSHEDVKAEEVERTLGHEGLVAANGKEGKPEAEADEERDRSSTRD